MSSSGLGSTRERGRNTVSSQRGTILFAETGCHAGARLTSPQAQPSEEHAESEVPFPARGCCSPGWVSAGTTGGRAVLGELPMISCCAPTSLAPFGKQGLRCSCDRKDFSVFRQAFPATLPTTSSAGAAACQCSPHRSPSRREAPRLCSWQPARLVSSALAHSPPPTGPGRRAYLACQCKLTPHRIFSGTFMSLILNIPSECLSTMSLGRLLTN